MTKYLFYFHYWQLPDEPIEAVIDFDPSDMATKIVEEINEEISYHTGIDPEPNTFMFVELFGLRPFNPKAWNMKLEEFVGHYGNSFVVIDLTKSDLGDTEFFRPKQVAGGQRFKFAEVGVLHDNWNLRAQFEVRLVSALIRWFQFYRKTKWLTTIPLDGQKHDYRVWQVKTEIPESSYGAVWRIILPSSYPNEPPMLFVSKKDLFIASSIDISHIWKDPDGSIFYFISDVTVDSTRWEETDFLVDFLLTGVWNFLARSLFVTFEDLLFYKNNVANPFIIKEAPPQQSIRPLRGVLSEVSDSDVYEDDIDYKVEIAEIQEEIDYNEEIVTKRKKPSKRQSSDDIDESEDDFEFEDQKSSKRFSKRKNSSAQSDEGDSENEEDDSDENFGFNDDVDEEEEDPFFSKRFENDNDEDEDENKKTDTEPVEIHYKEWVTEASEEEITKYGKLFTWLLIRVPQKALDELTLLQSVAPDHGVFDAIEWRYVIDELTEQQLEPFAKSIINYYYINTEKGLIYDTDRDFLRDTVFKKWKNKEKEQALKNLLRERVSLIKKVSYEKLDDLD